MNETIQAGQKARVVKRYERVYPNPLVMQAGDEIRVEREDDDGWWWSVHLDGRSGWVHESLFTRTGTVGAALRDYSAIELTVEEGEEVTLGELLGGWYWVTNTAGESGWVPKEHLAGL